MGEFWCRFPRTPSPYSDRLLTPDHSSLDLCPPVPVTCAFGLGSLDTPVSRPGLRNRPVWFRGDISGPDHGAALPIRLINGFSKQAAWNPRKPSQFLSSDDVPARQNLINETVVTRALQCYSLAGNTGCGFRQLTLCERGL